MPGKQTVSKVASVVSIILIAVLAVVFLQNVIFIVKGAANPEIPPKVFGVTPLVVLSGSMEGDQPGSFPAGSMLILKKAKDVEVGDVIAFMDPSSSKRSIVTHRVIEIVTAEDGSVLYQTKGDANNAADGSAVPAANIIGEYFFHMPHMGDFAIFLQEPVGMLIFIGVPVIGFIAYDVIRGQRTSKKKEDKTAEMEAELARLRALAGEGGAKPEKPTEATSEETPKDGE
ncbi:MAG: signal peptidase I [Clostridia bacterium]|nr:signal peptidase I [Clostridia bacterium]